MTCCDSLDDLTRESCRRICKLRVSLASRIGSDRCVGCRLDRAAAFARKLAVAVVAQPQVSVETDRQCAIYVAGQELAEDYCYFGLSALA